MCHEIIRGAQKAAEELACGGQLLGPVLQGSFGCESLIEQSPMHSPGNFF
jgi:hypothetical protein